VALDENSRAAKAYARAAELELTPQLRMVKVAPLTLRKAFTNYFHADERTSAEEIRRRLIEQKEDVSSLPNFIEPTIPPSSWLWVRLGGEFLLLGAAAYLFFLTLR
jgi:hypothetical protein